MIALIAELKPLDILGPIVVLAFGLAVAWVGLAVVVRVVYLLVQPFYAIPARRTVEEGSWWVWGSILVAGLLYWQLS
jgi:hypothetical protein